MDKEDFKNQLRHFYGGDSTYRHSLARDVVYTSGVKFFAEHCGGGAYWLLDIIATEPAIRKQAESFASITLTVTGSVGRLVVDDGGAGDNGERSVVFTRDFDFTTAFEGEWKFYFVDHTVMLPGEY